MDECRIAQCPGDPVQCYEHGTPCIVIAKIYKEEYERVPIECYWCEHEFFSIDDGEPGLVYCPKCHKATAEK